MTRRKFLKRITGAALLAVGAVAGFVKKAAPRKFVRAVPTKLYPGGLKALRNISKAAKWSG